MRSLYMILCDKMKKIIEQILKRFREFDAKDKDSGDGW